METQQVPDSILLTGACEEDLVKAGFFMAKVLNCQKADKEPCLVCPSCQKIQKKVHPDMIHIGVAEGKKEIFVDQIRQMEARVYIKPNEAVWRMVMISHAQKMNVQAQNALLKILEEPPLKTFFILTAPDMGGLLPTILSRCRKIHFPSMGVTELAEVFETEFSVEKQEAWTAARTAGGDKRKAMLLLNLPTEKEQDAASIVDWKARRNWVLDQMETLIFSSDTSHEQTLIIAQILSQDSEDLVVWSMILAAFFRDLGVYQDWPEGIIHTDRMLFFARACQKIPFKKILGFLDLFHETQRRLTSNVSVRLTMEKFCLGLVS